MINLISLYFVSAKHLFWSRDACFLAGSYTHPSIQTVNNESGALNILKCMVFTRVPRPDNICFPVTIALICLFTERVLTHRVLKKWRIFCRRYFEMHFLKENLYISLEMSLKFVLGSQIDNISSLVQVMAWRQFGDKPLPESMMTPCSNTHTYLGGHNELNRLSNTQNI